MQLEMTPVGEQRKYVSVILLSSQTLKCWVFSLCPSCTVCVSWQANLVVQENRYVLAMQDLQKAQAELDDKQAELDVVQAEYEQAMTEKQVTNYALAWNGPSCTCMVIAGLPSVSTFSKGSASSRNSANLYVLHIQHAVPP